MTRLGEVPSNLFDHWAEELCPQGGRFCQVVSQRGEDPANTLAAFGEVGRLEGPSIQEVEEPGVDTRPDGFHDVGDQRVPVGPCRHAESRSLTAQTCRDDHELLHEDLRRDRIDNPVGNVNVLERVAYLLERVSIFFARLEERAPYEWVARLAQSMRQWAGELRLGVRDLDARHPNWSGDE